MIELGELDKNHQEFATRGVKVYAISNDDQQTSKLTQLDFPNLVIVSDAEQNMAKAVEVLHKGAAIDGTDTNAPTTFLLDEEGTVRWMFRPSRFIERLSPEELAVAIDEHL